VISNRLFIGLRAASAIFTVTLLVTTALAATEKVLHNFNDNGKDGVQPEASLIFDAAWRAHAPIGPSSTGPTWSAGTRMSGYSTSTMCGGSARNGHTVLASVVDSSPAVANGVVYIGSRDNKVYALNARTGHKLWSYRTGDWVLSSPAVASGIVYVGSQDGKVYALNARTGTKLWIYATGGYVQSSPAVTKGRVYVGSGSGFGGRSPRLH